MCGKRLEFRYCSQHRPTQSFRLIRLISSPKCYAAKSVDVIYKILKIKRCRKEKLSPPTKDAPYFNRVWNGLGLCDE
jgi:hypothetical protein